MPNVVCGSPCSTYSAILEIWVMNVLIMPLHLARLGSSLTTTLPHDRFIITLTLLCVSMTVTTLVRSWNDCSTFEQMQHHFLKIEVSVGFFSSGPPCACAIHVTYSRVFLLLSGFSLWVLVSSTCDGSTFFIRVHRTEYRRLLRAQHVESSIGIAFLRAGQ